MAWIGTIASILGSFFVAFGLFSVGYIAFTIGSLAWLIVAYKREDKALATLNGTFFVANIIGVVRYIIL